MTTREPRFSGNNGFASASADTSVDIDSSALATQSAAEVLEELIKLIQRYVLSVALIAGAKMVHLHPDVVPAPLTEEVLIVGLVLGSMTVAAGGAALFGRRFCSQELTSLKGKLATCAWFVALVLVTVSIISAAARIVSVGT